MTNHCMICGRFMRSHQTFICRNCAEGASLPRTIIKELIREGYLKEIEQKDLTPEELDILYFEQLRQYDCEHLKDFYEDGLLLYKPSERERTWLG